MDDSKQTGVQGPGSRTSANEKQQNHDTTNALPLLNEIIISRSAGGSHNTVLTEWTPDNQSLVKELSTPTIGNKDGSYFLRCAGTQRSNTKTSDIAYILILDGDSRIGNDGEIEPGAPDPELVHKVLTRLNVQHLIYSSYSNGFDYHKYRVVIPCTYSPEQLPALLDYLCSMNCIKQALCWHLLKRIALGRSLGIFPEYPMSSARRYSDFIIMTELHLMLKPSTKTG